MNTTTGRIYGLDILRAYAIVAVVSYHGQDLLYPDNVLRKVIEHVSTDGVSVFFVLSGFLIGGILLKTINEKEFNSKELLHFWIRRWFRTLPAYYLILTILVLFTIYTTDAISSIPILNFATFTQNFVSPYPLEFFQEAWSLSVEEWFYIIIPFTLFLSLKLTHFDKNKIVLFWICTVILSVTLFRIYRIYKFNYIDYGEWDLYLRKQVVTRLDSIMYGFLGAYIFYHSKMKLPTSIKLFLFTIGGFILYISNADYSPIIQHTGYLIGFRNYFQITTAALGTLMLFPLLLTFKTGKGIIYKSVTFISLISYSWYLVHLSLVKNFLMPFIEEKAGGLIIPIYYLLYYILSISLAFIMYNYYEKPMTNLRDVIGKKKYIFK